MQRVDECINISKGVIDPEADANRAAGRRGEGFVRQGGAMISASHADARTVQRVAHRVCAFALKVEKQDRSHAARRVYFNAAKLGKPIAGVLEERAFVAVNILCSEP